MDSRVHNRVLSAPDKKRGKRKNKKRTKVPMKQKKLEQTTIQLINRQLERKRTAKYFDLNQSLLPSSTTIGFQALTLIPQGDSQSQRIADTIYLFRIDIRLQLFVLEAATDYTNYVRMAFLLWKPNTASYVPNGVAIFQNTSSVLSPFTFETRDDYQIIKDFTFNLTGYVGVPTSSSQHTLVMSLPLTNHRIQYNIGIGTGTGHVYFSDYSDSTTTPHPTFNLYTRVWYYDAD